MIWGKERGIRERSGKDTLEISLLEWRGGVVGNDEEVEVTVEKVNRN